MMIIKLQSAYDRACVYVNMEHIKYFYKTLDITYPGTTLIYTDGSSSKVKESPDEILELLKAEDPLREKISDQMDNIDKMLDSMEKDKCQYYDLLRALSKRVLNWSFGMEGEKPENEEHYNYPCDTCAFEDTGANSFPCSICKPGPGLLWVSKEEVDNENKD